MKKWLMILLVLLLPVLAFAEDELYPAQGANGLYGYINARAEWVIAPQFDMAYEFRGDYAVVAVLPEDVNYDDRWEEDYEGIIDRTGSLVVEPHYFFDGGYDGYYYGGKDTGIWVVYSGAGEECREGFFNIPTGTFSGAKWEFVAQWHSDSDLIPVAGGYASRSTGEMVLTGDYDWINPGCFYDGIAVVTLVLDEETGEMSDYFLINEQGETIPLPEGVQPDCYGEYANGRVPVIDESGMYGYADGKGNVVIPLEYADASNFSEGYAAVFFPEGDWGYIDVNGNTLARGFTRAYDFLNGYGEVWISGTNRYDNVTAWIDTTGAFVPFMDDHFYPITHDRMWMDAEVGSVSPNHLVDGEGNILSAEPVWLSDVGPAEFAGGLQPVMNTERKWGYMDLDGRIVIPFSYDYAWDFDGELAYVGLGERTGYIDQAGNAVYMWEDPIE